jgi:hypothetical protein
MNYNNQNRSTNANSGSSSPQRVIQITEEELDALVTAKVKRQLQHFFAPLIEEKPKVEWVDASEAMEPLGFPSKSALYTAIATGLFRMGKEVRDRRLPGRQKPKYQLNIEACQKRLNTDPEKRPIR